MVFEDANAGIEAAKRGGMYAFAVGAARYNKNADMSAESLEIMKQI